MKKLLSIILLSLLTFIFHAENVDLSFFYGTWAPENQLPSKAQIKLTYDEFYPNDSSFDFFTFNENYPYLGMFKHSGLSFGYVIKSCTVKEKTLICECYIGGFNTSDDIEVGEAKFNIKITVLGDDWIQIEGLESESLLKEFNKLYRVKEGRKKPVHRAFVNDFSVRVRTEPNLQSQTMYLLPEKYEVQVIDQSKHLTEVDGEKWCWYKISSFFCFDGWIYGKYLNINPRQLSDERFIKIENWGFRQGEIYTYFWNCDFSYYSISDISIDELQGLLRKIDNSGEIISNLNSIATNYEFSHLTGKIDSKNNGAIFRDIFFGFQNCKSNIMATDKAGFEFIRNKDDSNTILVKSNSNGCRYGVSIGMTKEAVEDIFGNPKSSSNNTIYYEAENFGLFTFVFYFDNTENLVKYSCTFKI